MATDQSLVRIEGDDNYLTRHFEEEAQKYERNFGDLINESSETYNEIYKSTGKEWGMYDTVALGQYLESWNYYASIFEEDVTTRDQLGDYLRVGLGLAAVQYVTLPANFLASVQPLSDESGMIYFRELVATATRGNVTKGDIIGSAEGKLSSELDSYYSEESTVNQNLTSAASAYTITLAAPVRPRIMTITVSITAGGSTSTYKGLDDGEGNIIGSWPTAAGVNCGSINYQNGQCILNTDTTGITAGTATIVYYQNLAQASEIPGFIYRLTSKPVRANYYILETQYSTLADYAIRRKFGRALSDDLVSSAVTQINAAVLSSMIRKLKTAAIENGTITWDGAPATAIPLALHRQTFPDALEAAAQVIDGITGRGAISFIIAGSYGRRILSTLGVDMTRKPLPGPYLTGFFQNIPVFYAPANLVADDEVIVGYRGTSWFEAPIVYAPWLPVVVVKGMGSNPFNRTTGVAHSAAVETLVKGFSARIRITNMT